MLAAIWISMTRLRAWLFARCPGCRSRPVATDATVMAGELVVQAECRRHGWWVVR